MAEEVRIDLTAKDDASRVIDKVADKVEDLERADAEVTVTADDDASRILDDVGDEARDLDGTTAKVTVDADTSGASSALADIDADLRVLREEAERTARQLDDVTNPRAGPGNLRGNAIADLTGPLGDASTAASDWAGVFDGLGDAAESAAGKIGLSQAAAGAVGTAISGMGVAVAAGAAAWALWRSAQEKARAEAEKTRKEIEGINEALAEGDFRKAATSMRELFGDTIDRATKAGLSVQQVTDYIRGIGDGFGDAQVQIDAARDALAAIPDDVPRGLQAQQLTESERAWLQVAGSLDTARASFTETTAAATAQDQAIGLLTGALSTGASALDTMGTKAGDAADDVSDLEDAISDLRGELDIEQATLRFSESFSAANAKAQEGTALTAQEINDLKRDYLDVAEAIGLSPVQITTDLQKISDGDIATVLYTTQSAINARGPLKINAIVQLARNQVIPPGTIDVTSAGGIVVGSAAAAPTVVVNQSFPRGLRIDALGEAHRAARRNGRLYSRVGR